MACQALMQKATINVSRVVPERLVVFTIKTSESSLALDTRIVTNRCSAHLIKIL